MERQEVVPRRPRLPVGGQDDYLPVAFSSARAPAIRVLRSKGVRSLLYALLYLSGYDGFLEGMGRRLESGLPVDRIASVASCFVSRVDGELEEDGVAKFAASHTALLAGIEAKAGALVGG